MLVPLSPLELLYVDGGVSDSIYGIGTANFFIGRSSACDSVKCWAKCRQEKPSIIRHGSFAIPEYIQGNLPQDCASSTAKVRKIISGNRRVGRAGAGCSYIRDMCNGCLLKMGMREKHIRHYMLALSIIYLTLYSH